MNYDELKNILFSEIIGDKNNKHNIIDMYITSPKYVEKLVKQGNVSEGVLAFLEKNIKQIKYIDGQVSVSCFKKLRYEELIKKYCEHKVIAKDTKHNETQKKKPSKTEVVYVKDKEPALYSIYEKLVPLHIPAKNKEKQIYVDKHKKRIQHLQDSDRENGYLIRRTCKEELIWKEIIGSKLEGKVYFAVDPKNKNKMLLHCYTENGSSFYRFYVNGKLNTIGGIQQYLEMMILKTTPKVSKCTNLEGLYSVNSSPNPYPNTKKQMKIKYKNLVVRSNIFKCMHDKHVIEDVDAIVTIINKNIEIEQVIVAAGYCKQCDIFFMLESTYQQLRKKGSVIFRAVEENGYLNQAYLNGNTLAQESILMQFGYSVSKTEGLTDNQRQKILSFLVEQHVLTKNEIISYLDFFIRQRKNDKYADAIKKWTKDRNYIRSYKTGEFPEIGVVYRE